MLTRHYGGGYNSWVICFKAYSHHFLPFQVPTPCSSCVCGLSRPCLPHSDLRHLQQGHAPSYSFTPYLCWTSHRCHGGVLHNVSGWAGFTCSWLECRFRFILSASPNFHQATFFLQPQERFTQDTQPHYIYSPREMTRWVRGIFEALRPLETLPVEGLIRVWAHEALRLFQDRWARWLTLFLGLSRYNASLHLHIILLLFSKKHASLKLAVRILS